ncbi:hypothetical protein PR003_g9665 [Phytophthora rubi]|uniref:Uncharacterized protein n=1 Tax=Phytophthora rubi TaxID=129364 RepID=A0A6A4FG51_9STRA|nr:hypothetical protein PR002_g9465 [Phytophthora rubi]KAE9342063.1 hypothetical protein PR003_g9665 [Phytophthora rubi]
MDLTAADGGEGRRCEAAGGDEGDANGGSESAAEPKVGAAAMGSTVAPESTNGRPGRRIVARWRRSSRSASGNRVESTQTAWVHAAHNRISQLKRKAPEHSGRGSARLPRQ